MPSLRQLLRLPYIARQPGGLGAIRRWKPFSVTAFEMARALQAQGFAFGTIIDGGANVGQFARAMTETFPGATLHCFEASPSVADTLATNLADRPQVHVHRTALGRTGGTLTFHQHAYSLASSALPDHPNRAASFPEADRVTTIDVPMQALEAILAPSDLAPPTLLKLDLQGYEIEALHGADALLPHIDYVLLETAFKPMYQGEPLFDEVYAFMQMRGFRFLRPLDVLRDATGELVQMDALFTRADARTEASASAPG
ncbi:MAG: FkbM family methyltransferase [Bacteroidota bacterium]